jgi:Poly(ADP-ribose) polymerase catalytic domain
LTTAFIAPLTTNKGGKEMSAATTPKKTDVLGGARDEETLRAGLPPGHNDQKSAILAKDWENVELVLRMSSLRGLTPADIEAHLYPQGLNITSMQPVLKQADCDRLFSESESLRVKWGHPHNEIEIAFHGTLPENIPGIIQHGFRLPGQNGHCSRFLPNWGAGIYCSPYARYSARYGVNTYSHTKQWVAGEAISLFICAVLRGRHQQLQPEDYRNAVTGLQDCDSHISSNKCEWILFNSLHIVPLLLLKVESNIFCDGKMEEIRLATSQELRVLYQRKIPPTPHVQQYLLKCPWVRECKDSEQLDESRIG